MEDMARLALVEQDVKDIKKFNNILKALLQLINNILDNPHEDEVRIVKNDTVKDLLKCQAFRDYLKHIGFQVVQNVVTFPKEGTLNKLRVAQAALERKLSFCYGTGSSQNILNPIIPKHAPKLEPVYISKIASNPLLSNIQTHFNTVLEYEDEVALQAARDCIPLVTLQLKAIDRMRERQREIKTGRLLAHDMTFDIALLMELLGWFKHKFFSWVNSPPCEHCGHSTKIFKKVQEKCEDEVCVVEVYACGACARVTRFPRYNDPRTLLRTRRGRCGEYANCFALLCRALGYDTRYVFDTTDHVWCEVYDFDTNSWLHVDPCEAALNTPLIYSHGWGKKLVYVIAVSRDDLQDVTWRYTSNHKEVIQRREALGVVPERLLLATILALRARRQAQVSAARRTCLAKRALRELADFLTERDATDYECHGRISGSNEWKLTRGEAGSGGHVFHLTKLGQHSITYSAAQDCYKIVNSDKEYVINNWLAGVYRNERLFRKVEEDWKQAYLARDEGEDNGSVSWMIAVGQDRGVFDSLEISAKTSVFVNGMIEWTTQFDSEPAEPVDIGENLTKISRRYERVVVTARLSGGSGTVAWQHAQLFRQSLGDLSSTFELRAHLVKE